MNETKNNGSKKGGVRFPIETQTDTVPEGGGRLRKMAEMAKEKAVIKADGARTRLADRIGAYAGTLDEVASTFEGKGNTLHHQLTGGAARALRELSASVKDTDAEILLDKAAELARKRPALFAAGCAALGFLGARLLLRR